MNPFATRGFWNPSPAWRWHGLGMLQREISEHTRVHIWHPSLFRVPEGFRRVHDHRFDLTSLVLIGGLIDTWYDVTPIHDEPTKANTHMWSIVHAKIQRGKADKASTMPTKDGDDPDVEYISKVMAYETGQHFRYAGECYQVPRGKFHQTATVVDKQADRARQQGLAITLVSRTNFDSERQARVLGDTAHSAIAGQHHTMEMNDSIVREVLLEARLVLS